MLLLPLWLKGPFSFCCPSLCPEGAPSGPGGQEKAISYPSSSAIYYVHYCPPEGAKGPLGVSLRPTLWEEKEQSGPEAHLCLRRCPFSLFLSVVGYILRPFLSSALPNQRGAQQDLLCPLGVSLRPTLWEEKEQSGPKGPKGPRCLWGRRENTVGVRERRLSDREEKPFRQLCAKGATQEREHLKVQPPPGRFQLPSFLNICPKGPRCQRGPEGATPASHYVFSR